MEIIGGTVSPPPRLKNNIKLKTLPPNFSRLGYKYPLCESISRKNLLENNILASIFIRDYPLPLPPFTTQRTAVWAYGSSLWVNSPNN